MLNEQRRIPEEREYFITVMFSEKFLVFLFLLLGILQRFFVRVFGRVRVFLSE